MNLIQEKNNQNTFTKLDGQENFYHFIQFFAKFFIK